MSNPNATNESGKGRGCLFYGCLTVVILGLLLATGGFFAVKYVAGKVSAFIEMNTDTEPVELPQVKMSDAAYDRLQARMKKFGASLEGGKAETLVLEGDEINALISRSADTKALKDKVYLTVKDDQIQGQLSWPLDDLASFPGMGSLKGRYLNGSAALTASLTNTVLSVVLESLEVNGKPVPEQIMAELRRQNLAKDLENNPDLREVISKLEGIEVSKGKITLRSKGAN